MCMPELDQALDSADSAFYVMVLNILYTFFIASSAHTQPTPISSSSDPPKPFHSSAPDPPLVAKQEKTLPTGSILNLNLGDQLIYTDLLLTQWKSQHKCSVIIDICRS